MYSMEKQQQLVRGTLTIKYHSGQYSLDELFDIAERNNPKRAFLFVSKILGKHIPVSPKKMRQSYQQLSQLIPDDIQGDVVFIGMAETAVGLAAGVFDEAKQQFDRAVLLTSTRHAMDAELLCEFKENHSHASDHLIYLPIDKTMRSIVNNARTLILIDDEVTTGNTFRNLIHALLGSNYLHNVERVITLTLTDWNEQHIEDCAVPVQSYALVNGSWHWQPDVNAPLPVMPNVNVTKQGDHVITGKQDWGRLGVLNSVDDFAINIKAKTGQTILVIGSGEFVWKPFLLAERLEREGANVVFSSTTRSPIAQGLAIQSVVAFSDNYGQGIANFIYNIAHQKFDRIILCIETAKESVDPCFLNALHSLTPALEVICYE